VAFNTAACEENLRRPPFILHNQKATLNFSYQRFIETSFGPRTTLSDARRFIKRLRSAKRDPRRDGLTMNASLYIKFTRKLLR